MVTEPSGDGGGVGQIPDSNAPGAPMLKESVYLTREGFVVE